MTEEENHPETPTNQTRSEQGISARRQVRGGRRTARDANRQDAAENTQRLRIHRISPMIVYTVRIQDQTCTLCHQNLADVCNTCINNNQHNPILCPQVQGECGHIFHLHCIESYLSHGEIRCPYLGCNHPWRIAD